VSKRNPTLEDVIRLTLPIQRKMAKQGAAIRITLTFEPCEPTPKKRKQSDRKGEHQ
jgi:hypothetical protein